MILTHPDDSLPLVLSTDASNTAIGAALHQVQGDQLQPLGFFSRKLSATETRYSTYGCELLAIYAAIKHFRTQVEGKHFKIYTDHKPLTYSLFKKLDSATPRQAQQLDYIAQFTTDIRYHPGTQNIVADALSRIEAVSFPTIPYNLIAHAQQEDPELKNLLKSTRYGHPNLCRHFHWPRTPIYTSSIPDGHLSRIT